MVLAKTNKGISSYYESLLVPDELQVRWCFVLHSHRLFLAPHLESIFTERYEIICV